MVICECLGLTDRAAKEKLERGACLLRDLVPEAALKKSCGACFDVLKEMIRQHQKSSAEFASAHGPTEGFSSLTI